MRKVGDQIVMKSEGPWDVPDAYNCAGRVGTIKTIGGHPYKDYSYDYEILFAEKFLAGNTWWVSEKDIASKCPHDDVISKDLLPTDASKRKGIPLTTGVFDYFPAALAEVAKISKAGNDQHNPGEPLHWSRGKSADHADCIGRHLLERGTFDSDGQRHSAKLAWRALAILQLELEKEGIPIARGAKEEKK